jgi:hypothetical protein
VIGDKEQDIRQVGTQGRSALLGIAVEEIARKATGEAYFIQAY